MCVYVWVGGTRVPRPVSWATRRALGPWRTEVGAAPRGSQYNQSSFAIITYHSKWKYTTPTTRRDETGRQGPCRALRRGALNARDTIHAAQRPGSATSSSGPRSARRRACMHISPVGSTDYTRCCTCNLGLHVHVMYSFSAMPHYTYRYITGCGVRSSPCSHFLLTIWLCTALSCGCLRLDQNPPIPSAEADDAATGTDRNRSGSRACRNSRRR